MKAKKLAELSMLTAVALIIFIVELQFPDLTPIQGVKLGLANIITVYAVYKYTAKDVFLIVITRVILGALFSSHISVILYSLTGALFCLSGMLILKRIIPSKYLWICSILGAVLHNTGQTVMAVFLMRSFAAAANYPVLVFTGCIAGMFTGLCAQAVLKRDPRNAEKT